MLRMMAIGLIAIVGVSPAWAETSAGSGALALATLVGINSPQVSTLHKRALVRILDGNLRHLPHGTIRVKASSVTCRASDVDITLHDCTLVFGSAQRRLTGRSAHELFATLIENGVQGDGAAGSIFEAASNLSCDVVPTVVAEKGGGGADCSFAPGP